MKRSSIAFILFLLILVGCSSPNAVDDTTELTVSAAASLTDSLMQVHEAFEKEHPHIQISYNFGGSGSLRKQIEQGAPIDIFLSASSVDYEKLVEQDRVEKGEAFLTNNLVLITRKQSGMDSLQKFIDGEELMAIGTPETVPAGSYGKEVLQGLDEWEYLESQSRLVYTKDVTQVLTLVKEGAAEVGIVYGSDVFHEKDIRIIQAFDSDLHSPIEYYVAMLDQQDDTDSVIQAKQLFYEFISSELAMEVFKENGFRGVE